MMYQCFKTSVVIRAQGALGLLGVFRIRKAPRFLDFLARLGFGG